MSASRPPPAVPAAASTPPPPPVHAPPPPPGATDVTGASYGAPAPAASANGQAYGMPATTGPPYGAPAPAASSNGRAYGAAPPPPPSGPYRPDPPGAQPSPLDLTFDPVRGQGPAAPFAYRTALPPIAPGTSTDLPPGYLTGEAREAKLRRDKRRGRLALAVAALVVLAAVAVTVKLKADSGKPQTVAILDVGDCFTGKPSDLTAVDCGQPHQGELFGEIPAPDPEAAYPGARQLAQDIGDGCLVFLTQYFGAGGDAALAKGIDFTPLTPTRDEWTGGATDSFCVAVPVQGQSLTGSIRNKGT